MNGKSLKKIEKNDDWDENENEEPLLDEFGNIEDEFGDFINNVLEKKFKREKDILLQ